MKKSMNILLVEDNEGDIELTKIAFREGNLASKLSVAHDGAEALAYLSQEGVFEDTQRPDLIMLDLNMPVMSGKELLEIIKKDDKLKSIPVIVFTSSNARSDVSECYNLHANSYILKPSNLEDYIQVAKRVEDFWTDIAQLPYLSESW